MTEITFPTPKKPEDFYKPLTETKLPQKQEERRLVTGERPQRARVFKSDFLEFFTYVRWYHVFMFWVPVIAYLFYRNTQFFTLTTKEYVSILFIGLFSWTLAEYLIHKHIFHIKSKYTSIRRMIYIIHGNHHVDPNDPLRGVMPITMGIFYAIILYFLFSLIVPIQYLDAFFASFLIGYLHYDGIHYYTHHVKPKFKLGKYLKRMHLIHHVHEDVMFGISSPLWDYILGTTYKRKTTYKVPDAF